MQCDYGTWRLWTQSPTVQVQTLVPSLTSSDLGVGRGGWPCPCWVRQATASPHPDLEPFRSQSHRGQVGQGAHGVATLSLTPRREGLVCLLLAIKCAETLTLSSSQAAQPTVCVADAPAGLRRGEPEWLCPCACRAVCSGPSCLPPSVSLSTFPPVK